MGCGNSRPSVTVSGDHEEQTEEIAKPFSKEVEDVVIAKAAPDEPDWDPGRRHLMVSTAHRSKPSIIGGLHMFGSLKEAIATCGDGDLIKIQPGTYIEPTELDVDGAVHVFGCGQSPSDVVIQCEKFDKAVLRLTGSSGVLENLHVRMNVHTTGEAVHVECGDWTLRNCEISGASGLVVETYASAKVVGCKMFKCGVAVKVEGDDKVGVVVLTNCDISGSSDDAVVIGTNGAAVICGNRITDAKGIAIRVSTDSGPVVVEGNAYIGCKDGCVVTSRDDPDDTMTVRVDAGVVDGRDESLLLEAARVILGRAPPVPASPVPDHSPVSKSTSSPINGTAH